jgi:hypothetical protein
MQPSFFAFGTRDATGGLTGAVQGIMASTVWLQPFKNQ